MISNEKNNTLLLPQTFAFKKLLISVVVLVIFHLVGFWGMVFSPDPTYFQNLTPLNLLLTAFLLFINHRNFNAAFFLFFTGTFLAGFFAEVVGIHTGWLFGQYSYGAALGFKLWEVPLIIGLNWVILVYCTGILARKWQQNRFGAAFLAAVLMVLLDFFIEPVALAYDFWGWKNGAIPAWNFVCWFGLAFVLQLAFQRAEFEKNNRMAGPVFATILLFFFALNLFL